MSRLKVLPSKPPPKTPIRASRAARFRVVALLAVHLLIAAHIAHWLSTGTTVTPVEPSEAMAFVKAGVVNAGLIFFAVTIVLTALFGRFFCGWACHLVALQDLARWLLLKVGIRPRPLRSRVLRWVPVLAFAYMFCWPLAYRVWRADPLAPRHFELTTSEFWSTFPGPAISVLTFLICGFVVIYFLGAKGFCTYACPYGAIFAVAEQVSPFRIRVTDACAGCGHCSAVCTSNVRVHEEVRDFGMVVNSGCMKCLDCVSVCPNHALYYGVGKLPFLARPRTEPSTRGATKPAFSWGQEAVLVVAFAAAFLTFRGLYGAIPFLLALGIAGILAYGAFMAVQLLRHREVSHGHLALKRAGQLTRPGRWAVAVGLGILVFWGHSAVIRWQAFAGERLYTQTAAWRRTALDVVHEPALDLTPVESQLVHRALRHFEMVEGWGLWSTAGHAAKRAQLHLLLGDSAGLRPAVEEALARGEEPATMHLALAKDALARGDHNQALLACEQAITADPRAPEPYMSLGVLQAQAGDLAAARATFARGQSQATPSPQLLYNSGLVAAWSGDPVPAIDLFKAALELAPQHLEARENLAGMLASMGRFAESSVQYRLALEQNPADPVTRFLLAKTLIATGRTAEARRELDEALRLDPTLEAARALRAELTQP